MTLPADSTPNPKRTTRRRLHRRFYGLTDEQQRAIFQLQRDAVVKMLDAMEAYFCAELDSKIRAIDDAIREAPSDLEGIDAEFTEDAK